MHTINIHVAHIYMYIKICMYIHTRKASSVHVYYVSICGLLVQAVKVYFVEGYTVTVIAEFTLDNEATYSHLCTQNNYSTAYTLYIEFC